MAEDNAKKELSQETVERFDFVVTSLSTAIKNSALYSASHPVFDSSIRNFKTSLDNWFQNEGNLEIGTGEKNLLLNGSYVREKNVVYAEVSEFLHRRGVLALVIENDISIEELIDFVTAVKEDDRRIREKGGILKSMKPCPNLKIKEVDYSALLGSATEEVTEEEQDVWKSLSEVTREAGEGKLPTSKAEFLKDFLKDSKRSATVLNKVYKQATTGQIDEETIMDDIRTNVAKMTGYFAKAPGEESRARRKELADIISKLDPHLVVKVLEESEVEGETVDLAKEITKDFSDEMLGDFIGSLITNEGGVNENLLKLFDKMMPEESSMGNIASMVTDNILQKNLDKEILSQLQSSIKELAKSKPDNEFVSQVYKLTLDTFVSDTIDAIGAGGELSRLIRGFKDYMKEDHIRKSRIRLFLNLLWLEDDPLDFEKIAGRMEAYFPQIIEAGDVGCMRDIIDFFAQDLRPEQTQDIRIRGSTDKVMALINDDKTIDRMISLIPGAGERTLDDVVYLFSHAKPGFKNRLIDAFIFEGDPFNKDKFLNIFFRMGKDISPDISKRISGENFAAVKDLLKVLKSIDPESAQTITKNLVENRNPEIRLEALRGYAPEKDEEQDVLFDRFVKEKDEAVQDMALKILVKTNNWEIMERLFMTVEKSSRTRKYLLTLVKSCGDNKMAESVPCLEKILFRRVFFNTAKTDELRIAAAVSLGRINTPESLELVKKGLKIRREPVRRMCEIVLRLGEHGTGSD